MPTIAAPPAVADAAVPADADPVATPRPEPLRRRADFAAVLRGGRASRRRTLAVRLRRNGLGRVRYGFAIGRATGGAVVRNRVRRRLRVLMRELPPCGGYDVLVTAREGAAAAGFASLRAELRSAVGDALRRAPLPGAPEGEDRGGRAGSGRRGRTAVSA